MQVSARAGECMCVCVCLCIHLLPDEHAGDEESIQAQEAIQDVAEPGVVHFHRLCMEKGRVGVRGQRSQFFLFLT